MAPPWMKGGFPLSRTGCVGSAVPPTVDPVAVVDTAVKAPKSGLGSRLLPVMGTCEMP